MFWLTPDECARKEEMEHFFYIRSLLVKKPNTGRSNWALNLVQHHVLATDHI